MSMTGAPTIDAQGNKFYPPNHYFNEADREVYGGSGSKDAPKKYLDAWCKVGLNPTERIASADSTVQLTFQEMIAKLYIGNTLGVIPAAGYEAAVKELAIAAGMAPTEPDDIASSMLLASLESDVTSESIKAMLDAIEVPPSTGESDSWTAAKADDKIQAVHQDRQGNGGAAKDFSEEHLESTAQEMADLTKRLESAVAEMQLTEKGFEFMLERRCLAPGNTAKFPAAMGLQESIAECLSSLKHACSAQTYSQADFKHTS